MSAPTQTISPKTVNKDPLMELGDRHSTSLLSLFFTFLKIGSLAFGGFMALVSVIEREVVSRKKMLSGEKVIDGISLATVLPGPVAVNLVAFVGYNVRGFLGALVSMTAVIIPSFVLILTLSVVYFEYGNVPAIDSVFQGILPAIVAVILAVGIELFRKQVKNTLQICICIIAATILLLVGGFFTTLLLIAASGLAGRIIFYSAALKKQKAADEDTPSSTSARQALTKASLLFGFFFSMMLVAFSLPTEAFGEVGQLLLTFAGMSLSLFGGGFVFIPMMQEATVTQLGWVTEREFTDAIALGQITPGPIVISATFIGYKVAGFLGALAATIGIFLPSALLMIVCSKAIGYLTGSPAVTSVYMGMRPCVVGMILAAAFVLAQAALAPGLNLAEVVFSTLVFSVSMVLLLRYKVSVLYIIPSAGILGLAFSFISL